MIAVIEHGTLIDKNLKRQRTTEEELAAQARLQKIASLKGVRWAIIEKGGAHLLLTFVNQRNV